MKVISQDHQFKKFDFSSIITKEDNFKACTIVKNIIDNGGYFKNSPKYQTNENLFGRSEPIWLKYRMSFLFSVFMYLGREVRVGNMMAWAFMTNLETAEDREKLWHHHWHPTSPNAKMLSGVWYLQIPSDVKDVDYCGTEFAPNGIEGNDKFYIRPEYGYWYIYPSDLWHRPGIVQSDKFRFVLAADVEYI